MAFQPAAFTILSRDGGDFEVVGPRDMHRRGSAERLQKLLRVARERYRALSAQIEDMDRPCWHGRATHVQEMKKKRLRAKDRISLLLGAMRRERPWQLASGSFGRVLLGRSLGSGDPVAIKLGLLGTSLAHEAAVLRLLTTANARGFPAFRHHGRQHIDGLSVEGAPSEVLAMELLGPSVDELWWATSCAAAPLSAGCVLRIGLDILHALERLHALGYVHNDLKPSNFCVGLCGSAGSDVVHLCDLGSATRTGESGSCDGGNDGGSDDGGDKADDAAPVLRGRPIFASATAHVRLRTEPSDDLESLCYVLRYLLVGHLPWEALEASLCRTDIAPDTHLTCLVERPTMAFAPTDALAAAKRKIDGAALAAGVPIEVGGALQGLWAAREIADHAAGMRALRAGLAALERREGRAAQHDWVRLGLRWEPGGAIHDADGELLHAPGGE